MSTPADATSATPSASATTTEPASTTDPAQRRTVVVLGGVQVLAGVGVATGIAVSSLIAADLSGSDAVGGLAQTSAVIGAALVAMPLAQLAAHFGRRPSLAFGYLMAMLGAGISLLGTTMVSWPVLLAGLMLFGAGSATGLAARFTATDLASPAHRARDLSIIIWATTVGSVLGPNLAGLVDDWALRAGVLLSAGHDHTAAPYALSAVMFGLAALAITALLRPDPLKLAAERSGAPPVTPPSPWRSLRDGWAVIRVLPDARRGLLAVVVSHLTMVGLMVMTPVHMNHHGASLQVIGLVISLHIAGMYALSPVFGWLSDAIGPRRVIVLGAVLLLAAAALLVEVPGHGGVRLSAGLILLGLGWSAGLVSGSALLAANSPPEHRTAVQGTSDVAMNLGGAAGGVVAGVVVSAASFTALALTAVVLLTGYLVLVVLPVSRKAAPTGPR